MVGVSLSVDQARLDELKKVLAHIPRGAETALARALNRALEGARREAIDGITRRYAVKSSYLRDRKFRILKAKPGNLAAWIIASSPKVPVGKFVLKPGNPPRQKGIPVKARKTASSEILQGNVREWPHAFIAQMRSGHVGLFSRKEGTRKITERMGPSVPQMLGQSTVINAVLDRAGELLDKELDRQVRLLLTKGGNKQ